MRHFFLAFFALSLLAACSTGKVGEENVRVRNPEESYNVNETEVDVNSGADLTAYLKRIPGVIVRGGGPNATVQVRGITSFGAVTSPLYVVNGTILGTSFEQLYSTIDPSEIARVRVLKSASETAAYGLQGGNGVLEFKLKK